MSFTDMFRLVGKELEIVKGVVRRVAINVMYDLLWLKKMIDPPQHQLHKLSPCFFPFSSSSFKLIISPDLSVLWQNRSSCEARMKFELTYPNTFAQVIWSTVRGRKT